MHPIAFYQKRTHLGAIARGMEMFAHLPDMTPARFDVLYAIYKNSGGFEWLFGRHFHRYGRGHMMAQSEITKTLGLSRQTIWKMVERLIELGLVTKEKCGGRNTITLTETGILLTRAAINAAFSERKPLPRDAPGQLHVPRYWRRPEMADPPGADASPPPRLGREVERIYTSFLWKRIGRRGRTGRRGKRALHLEKLDDMISDSRSMAAALGYPVNSIYSIRYTVQLDH